MAFTELELNEMAVLAISNYFDGEYSKDHIENNFKLAVKLLVENSKKVAVAGVKSISENGTSLTYKDNYERFTLTSDIIALLPKKRRFKAF